MARRHPIVFLCLWPLIITHQSEAGTRMLEPPTRASLWRYGYGTPTNRRDDLTDCGGYHKRYVYNRGECGVCGDGTDEPAPRRHEAGGAIAPNPRPVRAYKKGSYITVVMETSSRLFGKFEFRICNLTDNMETPEQSCFDQNPLTILEAERGTEYRIGSRQGIHTLNIKLPDTLLCAHCILQWRHITAYMTNRDSCFSCPNGIVRCHVCQGCGDQIWYVGCTDIAIYEDFKFKTTAVLMTTATPSTDTTSTTTTTTSGPASSVTTTTTSHGGTTYSGQCSCPTGVTTDIPIKTTTPYPSDLSTARPTSASTTTNYVTVANDSNMGVTNAYNGTTDVTAAYNKGYDVTVTPSSTDDVIVNKSINESNGVINTTSDYSKNPDNINSKGSNMLTTPSSNPSTEAVERHATLEYRATTSVKPPLSMDTTISSRYKESSPAPRQTTGKPPDSKTNSSEKNKHNGTIISPSASDPSQDPENRKSNDVKTVVTKPIETTQKMNNFSETNIPQNHTKTSEEGGKNPGSMNKLEESCYVTNRRRYPDMNMDKWCSDNCPGMGRSICMHQTCMPTVCTTTSVLSNTHGITESVHNAERSHNPPFPGNLKTQNGVHNPNLQINVFNPYSHVHNYNTPNDVTRSVNNRIFPHTDQRSNRLVRSRNFSTIEYSTHRSKDLTGPNIYSQANSKNPFLNRHMQFQHPNPDSYNQNYNYRDTFNFNPYSHTTQNNGGVYYRRNINPSNQYSQSTRLQEYKMYLNYRNIRSEASPNVQVQSLYMQRQQLQQPFYYPLPQQQITSQQQQQQWSTRRNYRAANSPRYTRNTIHTKNNPTRGSNSNRIDWRLLPFILARDGLELR